jgi:hypothetical protein
VDYNVLSTKTSHSEFFSTNACETNSLPNFRNIDFFCCIESCLVLFKFDISLSKFLVVVDSLVKNLTGKIKSFIETSVATFLDVCLVRFLYKSF